MLITAHFEPEPDGLESTHYGRGGGPTERLLWRSPATRLNGGCGRKAVVTGRKEAGGFRAEGVESCPRVVCRQLGIDTQMTRVVLIEAGPRVLAGYPEDLSVYAQRSLEGLGVAVEPGEAVTECTADGVVYGDRHLQSETMIWAAGVRASPAASWVGASADGAGRLQVLEDLTVPGHPEISAIGDIVALA